MNTTMLSTLTALDIALVVVGGVVAGVLNLVAAGGSLISFLVLGAVGLPPQVANATNLIATPASFLPAVPKAVKERRELRRRWRVFVTAIVGTLLGVYAFYVVPAAGFRKIVPVLLLVATATLIAHPFIQRWIQRRHTGEQRERMGLIVVGIFGTSVYAGFVGGGVGVLVLIVLGTCAAWPWLEANRLKNLICLATSMIGACAYAFTGFVDVPMAGVLIASLGTGGITGHVLMAWLARKGRREDVESVLRQVVMAGASLGAGLMLSG